MDRNSRNACYGIKFVVLRQQYRYRPKALDDIFVRDRLNRNHYFWYISIKLSVLERGEALFADTDLECESVRSRFFLGDLLNFRLSLFMFLRIFWFTKAPGHLLPIGMCHRSQLEERIGVCGLTVAFGF